MKAIENIIKYMSYFTAFILLLLVVLIFYDATARYLFSAGSTAFQELEWHFFDIIILFSIAYTLQKDAHVRVDIFYENFSEKTKLFIDTSAILFFILPFSFLIIYIGIGFTELSFLQDEASSDPGGLAHRWIVKSLMPLSFVFVALVAGMQLFKNILKWRAL